MRKLRRSSLDFLTFESADYGLADPERSARMLIQGIALFRLVLHEIWVQRPSQDLWGPGERVR